MKYTIIGGGLLPRIAVKDSDGKIERYMQTIEKEKMKRHEELKRTTIPPWVAKKRKRQKRKHQRRK